MTLSLWTLAARWCTKPSNQISWWNSRPLCCQPNWQGNSWLISKIYRRSVGNQKYPRFCLIIICRQERPALRTNSIKRRLILAAVRSLAAIYNSRRESSNSRGTAASSHPWESQQLTRRQTSHPKTLTNITTWFHRPQLVKCRADRCIAGKRFNRALWSSLQQGFTTRSWQTQSTRKALFKTSKVKANCISARLSRCPSRCNKTSLFKTLSREGWALKTCRR